MIKDVIGKNEYSIVITTCADKEEAKKIGRLLIEKQLVSCIQMFPIESIYFWKGEICNDNETLLFLKTKTVLFRKIVDTIKENHGYEVPEIIQIPITDGLPEYLKWINDCTIYE